MKKHEIHFLTKKDFVDVKNKLCNLLNIDLSKEDFAFTIDLGSSICIFINNKMVKNNEDFKNIVLWHEKAHANGIMDEEAADRWALRHLTKKQQKILISEWNFRHNCVYTP